MNNPEKDEIIKAAKELFDIVNNNRIWQKLMFGECPEDEVDEKLKNFNTKYQKWYGERE